MYNFRLETLLYFARIRQLNGIFRSVAFYGFGDLYDPCVVMITVQSGIMQSCAIYNRYSQVLRTTEAMMNVLNYTTVEWAFEDARNGYTQEHASYFNSPPSSPLPNLSQPTPPPDTRTRNIQNQKTQPLKAVKKPQYSDHLQADTLSYFPPTKNPTRSFASAPEPHHVVPPNNDRLVQERSANLIPLRLKSVPRSEVLQWKGNVKSIYMRTNGINTIAQIATMLLLSPSDVLQILRQLEKEGLISLEKSI